MILFDKSGKYILYTTYKGINVVVVHFKNNKLCFIIGQSDRAVSYASISLFEMVVPKYKCNVAVDPSLYINKYTIADCNLIDS